MLFSIPILIQERLPKEAGGLPLFVVRPVFHTTPEQRSEKLSRALNKLKANLQNLLRGLSEEPRHDSLAEWVFNPVLHSKTIEIRLNLKSGAPMKRFFVVYYQAFGRQICFLPAIPGLSFDLLAGQKLEERLAAVLTAFVRDKEKADSLFSLDEIALNGRARLSVAEVEIAPAASVRKNTKGSRALLFGSEEKVSGEAELRKVGQALQQWYPDDLQRALGREAEIEELARLLLARERRPILVVGPPKVGKTALIHELAWQIRCRTKEKFAGGRQIWLLSPMRLISGMSYLGEWEGRINAIIEHAREHDQVLYFDDLLGLFTAGVSAGSDLNVARVLKPHLETRSLRLLAEITPEALRVLREKDRAFADLFHIIPLEEPPEAEIWRVLIHLVRELEKEQQCAFEIDVLLLVYDLHRRFLREAAFPGKAAGFLRRLAVRQKGGAVTRRDALAEFSSQTGLQTGFFSGIEPSMESPRAALLRSLGSQVKGQDQALEAIVDLLVAFRSGLNDPNRPIGTMLLLGPTGVGKTESAKALARTLFGSAERLLRFDLNEFVDARAIGRLTGTAHDPDGLLTGAVRRRPFSVILFDEIEKAAPEVFDLLLAVLDEGRLADSLGRIADFTNCIILLSSNLGAREARYRLGFNPAGEQEEDAVYIDAARKFFRPEFFNRIDRIVPFRALAETELHEIAQRLLAQVQTRDGLRRRDCTLTLTEAARRCLVELGHHPQLGARALKRTVEREVVQRLAAKLAETPPSLPIVARLDAENGEFKLEVETLAPMDPTVTWARDLLESGESAGPGIQAVESFLYRIDEQLERNAPAGAIEWNEISPAQAHYYLCHEQFRKVERLLESWTRRSRSRPPQNVRLPKVPPRKFLIRQNISGNPVGRRLRDRVHLQHAFSDLHAEETRETADSPMLNLLREAAFLNGMMSASPGDRAAAILFLEPENASLAPCFVTFWSEFFDSLWGGMAKPGRVSGQLAAIVAGPFIEMFLPPDGAKILIRGKKTGWVPIVLRVLAAETAEAAEARVARDHDRLEAVPGPIIARYDESAAYTDFRTGLAVPDAAHMDAQDFRALMLSTLALPPELERK